MMHLKGRGLVKVHGPDAGTFLNSLLTNDVEKAQDGTAVYSALLTPQGKFLFDAFVLRIEADTYWLDVSRPTDFVARLSMYRLRSKVSIEPHAQDVAIVIGDEPVRGKAACTYPDARHRDLGLRAMIPVQNIQSGDALISRRFELGVPEVSEDLLVEKDFALEGLLDELGAIDFHKGCYVGQEMTSRMKRRTTIKNKLCRIRYDGKAPVFETPIMADGWEVGRMRTGGLGVGIAMIRFDRAQKAIDEGKPLLAGTTEVRLDPPDWLMVPGASS
jgi:tRNA-modifying protein YgfZ